MKVSNHQDKRVSYFYKITNPNGKIYIGQTTNIRIRLYKYSILKCIGQNLIYNSIKKYGWNTHKVEIIYKTVCDQKEANKIEMIFINFFNSYWYNNKERGLNLTKGGDGIRGFVKSEKSIKEQSNRMKGYTKLKEWVEQTGFHKKCILQYSLDNEFIKEFESIVSAERELHIFASNISFCLRGKSKQSGGFKWKYKNNG